MLAAIVKQMRMKYSRRKHATPALTEKIEKVLKIKIMYLKKFIFKERTNCSFFYYNAVVTCLRRLYFILICLTMAASMQPKRRIL